MAERVRIKLLPINPFTPRQEQIIKLKLRGYRNHQIAKILGISRFTLKNHISGTKPADKGVGKSALGILGIIEMTSGERPNPGTWIQSLFGDVVLGPKPVQED